MALTQKYLKSRFKYNPRTGVFVWKEKPEVSGYDKAWNAKFAGKEAGSIGSYGYWVISLFGKPMAAHRLAWIYIHGEAPLFDIDHINRDRIDNRMKNLRAASRAQNNANAKVRKSSKSGVKGVQKHGQTGKWRARIRVRGKNISLGLFDDIAEAANAYLEAAEKYYGEFAFAEPHA